MAPLRIFVKIIRVSERETEGLLGEIAGGF